MKPLAKVVYARPIAREVKTLLREAEKIYRQLAGEFSQFNSYSCESNIHLIDQDGDLASTRPALFSPEPS